MKLDILILAAVTGFLLVAIWLKEWISIAVMLPLARFFGFRCKSVNLFGLNFDWHDGRWERSFWKLSPLCQYYLCVDITKPVPPDIDKKEKQLQAVRIAALFLASALLVLAAWQPITRCMCLQANVLDAFLAATAIGLCWHSIVALGIMIYTYAVMMKKLGGYVDSLVKRLRQGEEFAAMQLRPVEELPYKNPTKIEIMMYYNFYLAYLVSVGRTEEMAAPIREMTAYFRNRDYIVQETMSYYWLIFYYSRYDLNPVAAKAFLDRVLSAISKDKDSNAKRVLAYYAFGIEHDVERARELMNEGFAGLEKCSAASAERELERKLLTELQGFLDNYSS